MIFAGYVSCRLIPVQQVVLQRRVSPLGYVGKNLSVHTAKHGEIVAASGEVRQP